MVTKIKKGDTVAILRGKDKGKQGSVQRVLPTAGKVVVDGLNVVQKHVKARRPGEKSQRIEVSMPVWVANVQLVCPQCKKRSRVGITREGGERTRVCKKCNAII